MLIEAYVTSKIDDETFECLVAFNRFFSRIQIFSLCPLSNRIPIEEIINRAIFIWKNPKDKLFTNYIGRIIYSKNDKIYVFYQGIEEIYKKIE